MYAGQDWTLPPRQHRQYQSSSGDPILYHDSSQRQQYLRQNSESPFFAARKISAGDDIAPDQAKALSKKGKKGENPQLHFSFVTHRMDLHIDVNRLLNDIRSCCPTAFDLILKKQQIDEVHSSQSGYGFVAFPTLSDCVTARDRLKGLTIEFLTYDCEVAHRSTRKHASAGKQIISAASSSQHLMGGQYAESDNQHTTSPSISTQQDSSLYMSYGEHGRTGAMASLDRYNLSPQSSFARNDMSTRYNPSIDITMSRYSNVFQGVDRSGVCYDVDADQRPPSAQFTALTSFRDQRLAKLNRHSAESLGPIYHTQRLDVRQYPHGEQMATSFSVAKSEQHISGARQEPSYFSARDLELHAPSSPTKPDESLLSVGRPDRHPFETIYNRSGGGTQSGEQSGVQVLYPTFQTTASSLDGSRIGLIGGSNSYFFSQLSSPRATEYRPFGESSWDTVGIGQLASEGRQQAVNGSMVQLLLQPTNDRLGSGSLLDSEGSSSFPPVDLNFDGSFHADL